MLPGRRDRWQRDPRTGVLVIVAGAALGAFVLLVAALLLAPAIVRVDLAASEAIRSVDAPWLVPAAELVTKIGDFWPIVAMTGLTAAVLLARGRRTSAATITLTVLLGSGAGALLKVLVGRVRPALEVARIPIPDTYSFPSGHALSSLLFFGSLAFLVMLHEKHLKRAVAIASACVLAALAIALARVYLGVHYLGDVVGSWLLGSAMIAVEVLVAARWGASSEDEAG